MGGMAQSHELWRRFNHSTLQTVQHFNFPSAMRKRTHIPEGAIKLVAGVRDARDDGLIPILRHWFTRPDQTGLGHQLHLMRSFASAHLQKNGRVRFRVVKKLMR